MPVLDVQQLKKTRGERVNVSISEQLPSLPVEDVTPATEAGYELTMTNIGGTITVEGTVTFGLRVHCNRCLAEFHQPVENRFQEIYYDREQPHPGGREADWIPFSGDEIDIMPEVVQNIVVNMPMRFICREDCRGLCPVCGIDLNNGQCNCRQDNVDPRLAKLKDLLK